MPHVNRFLEKEVLVSLLKLTIDGSISVEEMSNSLNVPVNLVIKVLEGNLDAKLIKSKKSHFSLNVRQRLGIALRAIEMGAGLKRICNFLSWEEFEDFSLMAFESFLFSVKKHYRFKSLGRRWEIDVIAIQKPLVVLAECKQWHKSWAGRMSKKAVDLQIERTRALVEEWDSIGNHFGASRWRHAYFVPLILSLLPASVRFYKGVPIVPIFQINDFISNVFANLDSFFHFRSTKVSYGYKTDLKRIPY